MTRTVDLKTYREYAVRVIDVATSELLGTGVFVTSKYLLTCSHVVGDRAEVRLLDFDGEAADGTVIARTAKSSVDADLWPFPDLAVVRLLGDRKELPTPACVLLDQREPLNSEPCYTYGFSRRTDFGPPGGSSAAVTFEGVEEDGYLKFQAGQIKPGLSGAPIISPARGAVIGLVAATRGSAGNLGGFAAPVLGLRLEVPGITPDGWRQLGEQLIRENAHNVIADRGRWHRVLPTTDEQRGSLGQPWAIDSYRRTAWSHPSELLRADYRLTPYLFRKRALADAVRWCNRSEAVSILTATADGGEGKTRFAIELAITMARAGWLTGFLQLDAGRVRTAITAATPRLIVVDYAETLSARSLEELLTGAIDYASPFEPARLLMLTRSHDTWADQRLQALGINLKGQASQIFQDRVPNAAVTESMTMQQRTTLFHAAARRFALAWRVPNPDLRSRPAELPHASPLQVLYAALDAVISGAIDNLDERDEADKVLGHEATYWRRAPAYPPNMATEVAWQAVAVATLAGADDPTSADRLLATAPRLAADPLLRTQVATWLHGFYPGSRWLNPVQPDRLGERLVESTFLGRTPGGGNGGPNLADVLLACDGSQTVRAVTVLERIAAADQSRLPAMAQQLRACLDELIDRAATLARGAAGTMDITTLGELLGQLLMRASAALMAGAEPRDLTALSSTYDRLGCLVRGSNPAMAARIFRAALAIDIRLVQVEPDGLDRRYALAISRKRTANLAEDSDPATAEELYLSAVDGLISLVEADPNDLRYRQELAGCYRRLGMLTARDRPDMAARFHHQALAIDEDLSAHDGDNDGYWEAMAVSYTSLGDLIADTNQVEAHQLFSKALMMRRRLADREPENRDYQRGLSVCYERLGNLVMDDAPQEARRHHLAALEIRQALADAEPRNLDYQRILAHTYVRLATLATEPVDIKRLHREALTIRVDLAAQDSDNITDLRNLSVSLGMLAAAVADEDPAEATSLTRAAVDMDRRLAARLPENPRYQLFLTSSLDSLADLMADKNPTEAERLYRDALAIDERLANTDPANTEYQVNLSLGLSQLGRHLETRDPAAAEHCYRAAVAVDDALVAAYPDEQDYQRSLSSSYADVADIVASRDPAEAEGLRRAALAIDERLAAADPADPEYQDSLGISLNKLGDLLADRDKDNARRLHHRAMEIYERLVVSHPAQAAHQRRVTSTIERIRRIDKLDTKGVLALILERRRNALGEAHPATLWAAHKLASALRELGDYATARDMDRATLMHRRRVLGVDHPHTLMSAEFLASDLRYLGDYVRACDLDQETLAQRRDTLGPDHPHTLWSADRLATDLRRIGDHDAASETWRDVLQRRRRTLGDHHRDTIYAYRQVEAATSRRDDEALIFVPGLVTAEPTTDWDMWAVAGTSVVDEHLVGQPLIAEPSSGLHSNHVELWYDGRYLEAIEVLNQRIAVDPADMHSRNARGQILADLGLSSLASRDLRQVIAALGPDQTNAAYAYSAWAYTFAMLGRPEMADEAFQIALKAAPASAWTFFRRGLVRYARGDITAALDDLSTAIQADQAALNDLQRGKAKDMIARLRLR